MKKKRFSLILILTVVLTLFAGTFTVSAQEQQAMRISQTTATINLGDGDNKLELTIENLPSGRRPRWVSWNENVAKVERVGDKGVVTPLRTGTAYISSGLGFPRMFCKVKVVAPSVKLNKKAVTLYHGSAASEGGSTYSTTAQLKATVKGANQTIVWSSNNESVATVKDGKVTPVAEGQAVITAKANGQSASCAVTVKENAISLNVGTMKLSTKGIGSSVKLMPTVVGANKKVTWTTSNNAVATVSGGKVTGKTAGETTITAKANGVEATCTVTVKPVVDAKPFLSISEEKVQLYSGQTKVLKTNKAKADQITWSSSNLKVATVDQNGKVTAVAEGTADISVKQNGAAEDVAFDTCTVVVTEPKTAIKEQMVYLTTNGNSASHTLDYQIVGPSSKAVWITGNKKVATVSKGKITAKGAGSTEVSVKANGLNAKVTVVVTSDQIVSLNQREYTLYTKKGNTVTLKATTKPKKAVKWTSSDEEVATVSKSGKVTAVGNGRTIITATADGKEARCYVQVRDSKVVLEKQYITLDLAEHKTEEIHADVIGLNQKVSYKSLNSKVASVNSKGLITAKKEGVAEISVTANGVTEKCKVWVKPSCKHVDEAGNSEWAEVPTETKEPTCLDDGIKTYECSQCEGKKQEVIPSTADHKFGKWITVADATENAEGLEKQTCSVCGTENTRIIPAKTRVDSASEGKLVWEDDFNGDSLNLNDWNIELHEPGWVNQEWQEYVDDSKNTYVEDGMLHIRAIKEERDGKAYYTSGRINTQGKHDFTYGRFEARAKVPNGKGFLPAFWMMPTDESYYGQWPRCGEIDIMEIHGDKLKESYGTLHFGGSQATHKQSQGSYTLPGNAKNFWEEFHVFACEWEPGEIRFYVDGVLFHKENDWFTAKGDGYENTAYPAPFDQPFYMILNLAVGGSWVGYPDDTTEFDEKKAEFVIDYVRVYQKDSYNTDVDSPVKGEVVFREPDASGNYILNGDFAKAENLTSEKSNWQLHLEDDGKAEAKISQKKLHITTTESGSKDYSVQVWQKGLPMWKNWTYKLTFDAYADEARTMITDISAPDRSFKRYLADTKVELGTETKSYEYTFTVKDSDDANGRLEFNLGNQGSKAAVHISNVRLEKIGEVSDDGPVCLPNGNYVYNGSFDEGNEPGRFRLAHWDWDWSLPQGMDAKVSVTADSKRELKVVVPDGVTVLENVTVSQEPIKLSGGKDYVLTFNARGEQAKKIQVKTAGQTFDCDLTTADASYKYKFKTASDLSGNSSLTFLLGTPGTTYIDNISIMEDSMIVNGDFSGGLTGYEVFVDQSAKVPAYVVDSLTEKDAFSIDIEDTGDQDWHIQLKQNNIKLEKDQWYKIAFDAKVKGIQSRRIMYALQRDGSGDDNWIPYSGTQKIDLTTEYQNFSHVFKMANDTDPKTILSISMGAVDGTRITDKHSVVIDNITLEETAAQAEPEIPVQPEGTNLIKNGDFANGEENWTASGFDTAAEGTKSFADQKAVFTITKVGAENYHVQLKQTNLILEKGAQYQLKFKIKSDTARKVKWLLQEEGGSWPIYKDATLNLTANTEQAVDETFTISNKTSDKILFAIAMGKVDGSEPTTQHVIEIDDVSLTKLGLAEPTTPEIPAAGTELIQNGDFSQGETNWKMELGEGGAAATAAYTDAKATYNITNVGTKDYSIKLVHTPKLTLEAGASYKVKFNIQSTEARTVKYSFMTPTYDWYGGQDLELAANEVKAVDYDMTVGNKKDGSPWPTSDDITFAISMGKIDGKDTPASTIVIDSISVKKVSGGGGDNPNPGDPDVAIGTELIKNGNFSSGETNWSGYVDSAAAATKTFTDGKARYEITNAGANNWDVQLKQTGLALEKGAKYKVNVTMGSSIEREVKFAFMGSEWIGGVDISLAANKKHTISKIVSLAADKEIGTSGGSFQISMGQIEGAAKFASHAIEIYSVSIVKVADDATADNESATDVTITPPEGTETGEGGGDDQNPDDSEGETGTELIKNGTFTGNVTEWSQYFHADKGAPVAKGTVQFTEGKARYEITDAGTADWNVQLKQENLAMNKGKSYKVNLTLGSSINRDVMFAIMGRNEQAEEDKKDVWLGGSEKQENNNKNIITLKANTKHTFSYVVKLLDSTITNDNQLAFQLSMGKVGDSSLAAHAIEIYSVSIVEVADGTQADGAKEESNVTIDPPTTSEAGGVETGGTTKGEGNTTGTGEGTTQTLGQTDGDGSTDTNPLLGGGDGTNQGGESDNNETDNQNNTELQTEDSVT